jgi:WD40 repeat protein
VQQPGEGQTSQKPCHTACCRLWGLADGSCLRTFEGHLASVLRIAFMSAGTQLLSSGADGLLKLWGVRTAECNTTFDAHEDKVCSCQLRIAAYQPGFGYQPVVPGESCSSLIALL